MTDLSRQYFCVDPCMINNRCFYTSIQEAKFSDNSPSTPVGSAPITQ